MSIDEPEVRPYTIQLSNFRRAKEQGEVLIRMESGITLFAQEIKNDNVSKPSCPECSSLIIFDVFMVNIFVSPVAM